MRHKNKGRLRRNKRRFRRDPMETYKILTGKKRLNLKTFFQLSQPRLDLNLARTAGVFTCVCGHLWWEGGWTGDIIACHIVVPRGKYQSTVEVSDSHISREQLTKPTLNLTQTICWSTVRMPLAKVKFQ